MRTIYKKFCKAELALVSFLLAAITALVFTSAVLRTIGKPVNWAMDMSLLLFAWEVFLGGDVAVRETELVSIDMIVRHLPKKVQQILKISITVLILGFLGLLIWHGIPLVLDGMSRRFETLPISYAFCTLSVPVGACLMGISFVIRLVRLIKGVPEVELAAEESEVDV